MRRGHIKLNGQPYVLAGSAHGAPYAASAHVLTGPWANQIASGPREYHDLSSASVAVWEDLRGGAGQHVKGRDQTKYARGTADTRSGDAILPPLVHGSTAYNAAYLPLDGRVATAYRIGISALFQWVETSLNLEGTQYIDTVGIVAKRIPSMDYSGLTGPVSVQLRQGATAYFTATFDILDSELSVGSFDWLAVTRGSPQVVPEGDLDLRIDNSYGASIEVGGAATLTTFTPFYKMRSYYSLIDGPPSCFREFTGQDGQRVLYAGVTHKVVAYDKGGSWVDSKSNFSGKIVDLDVYEKEGTGRVLVIAQGASLPIFTHTGGSVGGAYTTGSVGAQCLAVHDDLLWRAEGAEISATDDLLEWGVPASCGRDGDPVIGLQSQAGKLFALTRRGLFEVTYPDEYPYPGQDAYVPIFTRVVNLEHDQVPHNYNTMIPYGQGLVWPSWYGLVHYESGLVTNIGLGTGQPLGDDERLQVYAAQSTSRGIYAGMSERGLSYNRVDLYQVLEDAAGWHPLFTHPVRGEEIRAVHLAPSEYEDGSARLFFGAGYTIQYLRLPLWTQARNVWSLADYADRGWLEYSAWDDGRVAMTKDLLKLRVRADNLAGIQRYIDWSWSAADPLTAATWATLGRVGTAGITEIGFPTGSIAERVRLRADLYSADPAETPVLDSVELWYQDIVPGIRQFRYQVVVGEQARLADGTTDPRGVREQWADLLALEQDEAVILVDELGDSYSVRMNRLARTPRALGGWGEHGRQEPQYLVDVEMTVVEWQEGTERAAPRAAPAS